MEKIELLSPAGSMSALKQAVFNGADSVYLGIKQFNARNNIDGFNLESLKEAVCFAHLYNVKVYLTINILFKDDELFDAVNIIAQSNNVGVDAFIIQDIGLANIIHKLYPNIVLHASTQLAIHNLEGALEAVKIGFKRVVLARETPLSEIKRIKENSKIELEFFAQGALCVSFSGNCYMCSHLKNKSGNRGECLQFCRLKYNLLKNGKNINSGYLLSAKDICMINNIQMLKDAGIGCLKIEGRARRDYYVATATKIYRKALDNDTISHKELDDLKLAFNREYTPAYLNGNSKIISKIQGHNGLSVGKVKFVRKGKKFNEIFIDTQYQLRPLSTLKFLKNNEEKASISAVDIKYENGLYRVTTTNSQISSGDDVNLLSDEKREQDALILNKKIPVNIKIKAIENERITCDCVVNDTVFHFVGDCLESAKSSPIKKEDFYNSFSKSEYFEPRIEACVGNVFMAKSKINEMRRICFENLYDKICEDYFIKKNIKNIEIFNQLPSIKKYAKKVLMPTIIDTNSQSDKLIDNEQIIIYDPEIYTLEDVKNIKDSFSSKTKLFLNLPNFATQEDINLLKEIVNKLKIGVVANNIYALNFDCEKIAGGFLNIYNSYTVNYLQEKGIDIFYTKELSEKEIKDIATKTGADILQDKKQYMTLRHCPIKHFVGGSCNNCKYCKDITYKMQDGTKFKLTRKKVKTCTFYLEDV